MYEPTQVAAYYASLFPARSDVYSRWTEDGWRPVREPLTPDIITDGLTGKGPSISGFMIAPGSTSHSLALDFDLDDGLVRGLLVASKMEDHGLPAYVVTSRRGCHLWCVLDRPLPAVSIRASMHGLLQACDQPNDPKIELRPGSDTVSDGGLGHALRLPLMPHPKTGKRGTITRRGAPVAGKVADILLGWELASADLLLPWAEKWKRPPVSHIPPKYAKPSHFPEDTSSASDILRELWGVPNARPGRSVKCPAHDDKMPSLSILRDDKRVICKAGHCELNNDDRGRGTHELRTMAPKHG